MINHQLCAYYMMGGLLSFGGRHNVTAEGCFGILIGTFNIMCKIRSGGHRI